MQKLRKWLDKILPRISAQLLNLGFIEKLVGIPTKFKAIPIKTTVDMLIESRKKETNDLEQNQQKLFSLSSLRNEPVELRDDECSFIIINDLRARLIEAKRQIQSAGKSIKIATKWSFFLTYAVENVEDIIKAMDRGVTFQVVTERPENIGKLPIKLQTLMNYTSFQIQYVSFLPSSIIAVIDKKEVNVILLPRSAPSETGVLQSNNLSLIELAENYFEVLWNKIFEERAHLERYRSFVELTGELGWTTNADGEVVEDIPSFRNFTGQTYGAIKGWGWADALHPDDVARVKRVWKEAVEAKKRYEIEYRLRRHDGVYRYFMVRGVPVFGENGHVREWIGICIDITERKQFEEEIKRSCYRVEHSSP